MRSMWPLDLLCRRFAPSDVELVTGVPPARQRLWISRHSTESLSVDFREAREGFDGRQIWTWRGIQKLQVFTDAMSDLADGKLAGLITLPEDHAHLYDWDYRNDDEDLFIAMFFDGPLGRASTCGIRSIPAVLSRNRHAIGSRCYFYNLSEMQRRLAERASNVGLLEGPGAESSDVIPG